MCEAKKDDYCYQKEMALVTIQLMPEMID